MIEVRHSRLGGNPSPGRFAKCNSLEMDPRLRGGDVLLVSPGVA